MRMLLALRRLELPLEQAAALSDMCAAGRCDGVSSELRELLAGKRSEVARRMADLRFLDKRLALLAGRLGRGDDPRAVVTERKEISDVV